MKKITVLLLVFVLTVFTLCACRGKAPSETAGPTDGTMATPMATLPTIATRPSQSATNPSDTAEATDNTEATGSTDATDTTGSSKDHQARRPIAGN